VLTAAADVQAGLESAFGAAIKASSKVIEIGANGSRRSSDVIVAFEFRRFHRFNRSPDQNFDTGICFFRKDGPRIANYPKQHPAHCNAKHHARGNNFKPLVRILKNLRGRPVETGKIA
jgi:hypothetical protein